MRLDTAIHEFETHLRGNGCSRHTIRAYLCDLNGLHRFYESNGSRVEDVTPSDVARFMASRHALAGPRGRTRSPGAVNRVRAALKSFFRWLGDTGQLGANPAAALRVRAVRPIPPAVLTRDDEERLMAVLEGTEGVLAFRDLVMLRVLLGTGIRIGELIALDTGDVDLANSWLRIHSKGGGHEVRYLNHELANLLWRYMGEAEASDRPLFAAQSGRRITARQFARRLDWWAKRAGLSRRITPHMCRHTLATRLLASTGNLRLVQRALGHRRVETTTRYAQVADEALAAALEGICAPQGRRAGDGSVAARSL
ncbi:MAG TPA: tyrosine-type recombinase/integrase [Planctomycetota bacterium]|nr:tyrosine-type recombinase/integrase [Planctomycetota bacterium]